MCDDPLCNLVHEQLRKENERLQRKAQEATRLRATLRNLLAELEQRETVDANAVVREAVIDGE